MGVGDPVRERTEEGDSTERHEWNLGYLVRGYIETWCSGKFPQLIRMTLGRTPCYEGYKA